MINLFDAVCSNYKIFASFSVTVAGYSRTNSVLATSKSSTWLDVVCLVRLRQDMGNYVTRVPIPVATRCKAWFCGRSPGGIAFLALYVVK